MLTVPEDSFLLGCVFAIADYPEQMPDKQLLATWKKIIQAHGGIVDPTLTSRCTHLLCESQVSNMYSQVSRKTSSPSLCLPLSLPPSFSPSLHLCSTLPPLPALYF
uniref:BRCT domain-containing protein n=1 Tax=Callorhinchus milii TaxID=7868 RepID=A0A4W3H9Y9_CALMI